MISSPFFLSWIGSKLGAGWRDSSCSSLATASLCGLEAEPATAGAVTLGLDSSPTVAMVKNSPKGKKREHSINKSNYISPSLLTYFIFNLLVGKLLVVTNYNINKSFTEYVQGYFPWKSTKLWTWPLVT